MDVLQFRTVLEQSGLYSGKYQMSRLFPRNLVLVAIGSKSLFPSWITDKPSSFDIILLCYEAVDSTWEKHAKAIWHGKGYKFSLLSQYLASHPNILEYDAIFIPDDDLSMSMDDIQTLFELFHLHGLELAQPCLDRSSYFSHRITRWCGRADVLLRYTNFVEIMCPLFSRRAFDLVKDTFHVSPTGYGLDYAWPHRLASTRVAIIDAIQVHHGKKILSPQRLKEQGINPRRLINDVVKKLGATRKSPRVHCYITAQK